MDLELVKVRFFRSIEPSEINDLKPNKKMVGKHLNIVDETPYPFVRIVPSEGKPFLAEMPF